MLQITNAFADTIRQFELIKGLSASNYQLPDIGELIVDYSDYKKQAPANISISRKTAIKYYFSSISCIKGQLLTKNHLFQNVILPTIHY